MRSTEYFELFRGVFACNLTLLINKKKYSTFHFNIAYGSAELCGVRECVENSKGILK